MNRQKCRVCGRPVERKSDKGRPKEAHGVCIALESRLAQVDKLLSQIKFQDKAHLKRLRGDLFSLVNGPLHPYAAQFAPDDANDAPIEVRREKAHCLHEKENP